MSNSNNFAKVPPSSMTGFGKGEVENDHFVVTTEIKTVNHRFKDFRFKMSSQLAAVESELKNKIEAQIKRGSIDIYINYRKKNTMGGLEALDQKKINLFIDEFKKIIAHQNLPLQIRPTDFLRPEFALDQEDKGKAEIAPLAIQATEIALKQLLGVRQVEGKRLTQTLLDHLAIFEKEFSRIEKNADVYRESVEKKLREKVSLYQEQFKIEDSRILQEVVFYLEKLDVHEEINRIKIHLEKLKSILTNGHEVGRQIDFIVQELNRETNTIGSKTGLNEVSDAVVNMKVLLEKIREQALNLE